ncbi:hypothetical protein C1645_813376 [Glomus cerebriforme]|uniref:Uncharacterized protein n=1 Tax=Glomus cerebriforme TaxID=658196 RepID=A0A397TNC0_9GLOM|nr:hypothetical protein C1645_813376 [Glomus cerebriforme]
MIKEEIKSAIKISKDFVNWIVYNKWIDAGRPYEEHDKVLMNLEFENKSSQTRSAKCENRNNNYRNSGNVNQKARKISIDLSSTKRTETTAYLQKDKILDNIIEFDIMEKVRKYKLQKGD